MLVYPHGHPESLDDLLSSSSKINYKADVLLFKEKLSASTELKGICRWLVTHLCPDHQTWLSAVFNECNLLISFAPIDPVCLRYDLVFVSRDRTLDQDIVTGWHEALADSFESRPGYYTRDDYELAKSIVRSEKEANALREKLDSKNCADVFALPREETSAPSSDFDCEIDALIRQYQLVQAWLQENAQVRYDPLMRSQFIPSKSGVGGVLVCINLHTFSPDNHYWEYNSKLKRIGVYPLGVSLSGEDNQVVFNLVKDVENYQHYKFPPLDNELMGGSNVRY